METRRILIISKWCLVVVLVLGLLPCAAMASDTAARDKQLIEAAKGGDLERVKTLLAEGADVNAKSFVGRTALMEAAARDHQLEDGWYFGLGPVMRALFRGSARGRFPSGEKDPRVVKVLLQKGADVRAKDRDGWTALKRAQYRGATEIVGLLKAHGAKV